MEIRTTHFSRKIHTKKPVTQTKSSEVIKVVFGTIGFFMLYQALSSIIEHLNF